VSDEPLIWTAKGNLPVASLRHVTKREDVPGTAVLIEEWYLGEELVKRNVHVLPLVGICLQGTQANL
jgi:hypothetical protein